MIPSFSKRKCSETPPFFPFDDEFGQPIGYTVGYLFVPNYMPFLRARMLPVAAQDGAFMRKLGQGHIITEVTRDDLMRLHPVGIQHFKGPESSAAYAMFNERLQEIYTPEQLGTDLSCIVGDGAPAIETELERSGRAAHYLPCLRHYENGMSPRTRRIFDSIRRMPPSRKHEVGHLHVYRPCDSHCETCCASPLH
jgi:hypothetical protein